MKIIFFGTFQYAVPALEELIKAGYEITAVVTNPDSTQGRKKQLTVSPIKLAAQAAGLTILQPASLKSGKSAIYPLENSRGDSTGGLKHRPPETSPDSENRGSKVGGVADFPDLGIVVAYGKIIPKEIIELPKYGIINIHPSLLPAYRGPSPIQSAILNGEKETGVTIMKIDEELDHGAILSQTKYQIPADAYHPQIAMEIFQLGAELLIQTIPRWLKGKITPRPQDHSQATFTKKFSWPDGRIDWKQSAEKIYNQIRALNPEPGTWTTWKQDFQVKILKILKAFPPSQGSTLDLKKGQTLHLPILPQEVQLEGKKSMTIHDFLRGVGNKKLDFE